MEYRTAEEKLLHDYAALEEENARLADENMRLRERVKSLEKINDGLYEQARRMEVERDQRTDCILDMMQTARGYGIEQPEAAE